MKISRREKKDIAELQRILDRGELNAEERRFCEWLLGEWKKIEQQ